MPKFGLRTLIIATAAVSAYLAMVLSASHKNQTAAIVTAAVYSSLVLYLVYRLPNKN